MKNTKRKKTTARKSAQGGSAKVATEVKKPEPEREQAQEKKQEAEQDIGIVREDMHKLVKASAKDIVSKVIAVTVDTGQLASAKYLFEAAGLYPAPVDATAESRGDSLAETILKRLGLPTHPPLCGEDPRPSMLASEPKAPEDTVE